MPARLSGWDPTDHAKAGAAIGIVAIALQIAALVVRTSPADANVDQFWGNL